MAVSDVSDDVRRGRSNLLGFRPVPKSKTNFSTCGIVESFNPHVRCMEHEQSDFPHPASGTLMLLHYFSRGRMLLILYVRGSHGNSIGDDATIQRAGAYARFFPE